MLLLHDAFSASLDMTYDFASQYDGSCSIFSWIFFSLLAVNAACGPQTWLKLIFSELPLKNHGSFWPRLSRSRSFYYKKIIFSELQLKKTDHFGRDLD